jgi:lysine decarboxylase
VTRVTPVEPHLPPAPRDPYEPRDRRDPRGLRDDAPLLDAWLTFTAALEAGDVRPFTIPGHKHRTDLVGPVVAGDVPLFGGLDTVGQRGGRLAAAERRAARAWGADWARLSVGGSTHGNQALALALGTPGRPVVVARTLHRSMLLGLVLAGLDPVWVHPDVDPGTGLPLPVPVAAVREALAGHPDACGVLLGDPAYVGTTGDVAGQAAAAHAAGVPLVVDAAWGAHFGFHPALPPHALAAGADALVTSAHKMLPAVSQAALVLARTTRSGGLLDPARLERGFEATHTTSPAGAVLASADAARALFEREGRALLDQLLPAVAEARARLRAVPGLVVPGDGTGLDTGLGTAVDPGLGSGLDPGFDPAKLVVVLAGTGADGTAVEAHLLAAGLPVEQADRDTVIPALTVADRPRDVDRLVDVLVEAVERHRGAPRSIVPAAAWTVRPEQVLSPREAFFAWHRAVPAAEAVGRVSAELIAPYPPGVPVLAPGERITAEAVDLLREAAAGGTRIAYAADPTLTTFHVVDP